jgi:citrate lyase gamma subunit
LQIKRLVQDELESGACIFDLWTSITNDSNLGTTLHYITNEFELRTIALGIKSLNISHTGYHINAAIEDVLVRWNIHDKIVEMVTDNGSNVCVAIRQYSCIHLRCLAHTTHMVYRPFSGQLL